AEGVVARPRAPQKARLPAIAQGQTGEQAAREALRSCLDQVTANVIAVRHGDDMLGPHQLRVGLRRLRSAFSVFGYVLDSPQRTALGEEAKWLGAEVSALRDFDVAAHELIADAIKTWPGEAGFPVLREILIERGDQTREELRGALNSTRCQSLMINLAKFTEARGWLNPDDFEQTTRLASSAHKVARKALNKAWKGAERRAEGLEGLTIEQRHDLRKQLKKLRYAVSFVAPLYPEPQVSPFLKSLKKLQTLFGALNDLAMAEAMFTGPEAILPDDAAVQRAVGLLIGSRAAEAEQRWTEARTLWTALSDQGPFWR
ncbi:MAG: CHAD domain-containing protein, partial [Pseudomonadota bacterium]